ncbi:MAG: hypothetical protein ACRCXH_13465, partial [Shewanella sp.]
MEFAIINQIDNGFELIASVRSQLRAWFTYDNCTAAAFKLAAIARKAIYWVTVSVIFLGLLAYTLGQATANYCGRHNQPTA